MSNIRKRVTKCIDEPAKNGNPIKHMRISSLLKSFLPYICSLFQLDTNNREAKRVAQDIRKSENTAI